MEARFPHLKDQIAVITGGSGVLCSAMARALAAQGARVAIVNRTLATGEALADSIMATGGQAMALNADVLDEASLEKARDRVAARWGTPHILINGAGGNRPQASTTLEVHGPGTDGTGFFDLEPPGVQGVLDLNLMGTWLPTRVFGRLMVTEADRCIVNLSSMGAYQPMTKVPAYCAAKAAVNNLTQWLAVHFAPAGLRVNALAPGFFATEQNRHLLFGPDGAPTPRTGKILAHTPMGRLGEAQDLCGTLLWLCDSTLSGFVTGAVIPVDGGFMAYSGV